MGDEILKPSKKAPRDKSHHDESSISKIPYLKKRDGEPLWKADVRYDFLKAVFDNEQKVFTNSYEPDSKQCFADLYINAMSGSSMTSKVLREYESIGYIPPDNGNVMANTSGGFGPAVVPLEQFKKLAKLDVVQFV